jgi:hypothetical protein
MPLLNGSSTDCQFDNLREGQSEMSSAARSLVVVVSLTAWFALSNHCALGVVTQMAQAEPAMSDCPMHAAPAKKKPATKTPCCKDVRAVLAKIAKAAGTSVRIVGLQAFAAHGSRVPLRLPAEIEVLDTGPPCSISFAESVLQESMLSHAPPVS